MKKNFFLKFFLFAVVASLVTFTSCKDYDDDINKLEKDITALKADLPKQIEAVKTELNAAMDTKVAAVKGEVETLKTKLADLEKNSATKAELDACKKEILEKAVSLETYEAFKKKTEEELQTLKDELDEKASKEDLAKVTTKLDELEGTLDKLGVKVDALEKAVPELKKELEEALGKAVKDLEGKIATLKAELASRIDMLEGVLEIKEGKSEVIADIYAKLGGQLEKIKANEQSVKDLKGDLTNKYNELVAVDKKLQEQISANVEAIAKINTYIESELEPRLGKIETALTDLETRMGKLEKALDLYLGGVNALITDITLDYKGNDDTERTRDLFFSTTDAVVDFTFAEGVEGAVTFVKGERLADEGVTIKVKVSPANADLSKMLESIKLIRSDANADINKYVVASKAERSTELFTRATPTQTGLWDVTFTLKNDADLEDLDALTTKYNPLKNNAVEGRYAYAVAIENTFGEANEGEERFVISDFGVAINASPRTPCYDLNFEAGVDPNWTPVSAIKNRYHVVNPKGEEFTEQVWLDAKKGETKDGDNRSGLTYVLPVEYNKPFNVRFDSESECGSGIYGYYITLDKDYASGDDSDDSEWTAWSSYTYEGLNKLYRVHEVAELKVSHTTPIQDEIGFRVHAVNWDGTLVDPDGKAFYVYVGSEATDWNKVATKVVPAGDKNVTATKSEDVAVTLTDLYKPATMTWETDKSEVVMDYTQTPATVLHDAEAPAFHAYFVAADGKTVLFDTDQNKGKIKTADLTKVAKVYTKPTVDNWLAYKDGKAYNGKLTVKNDKGVALAVLEVTFTKELPRAPKGFSVKDKQLQDGVYNAYLIPKKGANVHWTAPEATKGTMVLDQVFNFGEGERANYFTVFEKSRLEDDNIEDLIVKGPQGGTLEVLKDFIDNTTGHSTTVYYNYGMVSTETVKDNKPVDFVVPVEEFKTVYSNIYNSTYSWAWDEKAIKNKKATTEFIYGEKEPTKLVIDFQYILGKSTRDSKYNAKLSAPYLSSLQVTGAKVVSKANGLEEYFTVDPAFAIGATTIQLKEKSGSTNPTADVPSTLVITAKDMYENDVVIELGITVKKR